ncbi:MAG TPA: hypothetical protein VG942_02100 [Hyphomonadaceae bacterium]|nr:hypothetical protein [Hyphomonadaceae bacterium]
MPNKQKREPRKPQTAHPGFRESFEAVAANARDVLRERGLSDDQIDAELSRAHRDPGLGAEAVGQGD